MKINLRAAEPIPTLALLASTALDPDAKDVCADVASRYRRASAELVELDVLVAQINDFWLAPPLRRLRTWRQ